MAETAGPTLQGEIRLATDSFNKGVKDFVKSIETMDRVVGRMEKSFKDMEKTMSGVRKSYDQNAKAAKRAGDVESKAAQRAADMNDKKTNAIIKADSKLQSLIQRIQKSNTTEQEQIRMVGQAQRAFHKYRESVQNSSMKTQEMQNINTRLSASFASVGRNIKQLSATQESGSKSAVANVKALSQMRVSYDRVTNSIKNSNLEVTKQQQLVTELTSVQQKAISAVNRYGTNSREAASALARFRETASRASISVRNVNAEARKRDLESWKAQMRDLSSSVQLALGPLSGIASRVMALTALFSNNAAVVAGFIASLTGLSVAFSRSVRAGIMAETTLLNLKGIVAGLGEQAAMTGQELFDLGTQTGLAFLTSAKQGREAAGALATFGSIGRDQFDEVLSAAQGLTQIIGGDLRRNTIRLGRLMEDPAANFQSLTRYGITFTDQVKEQILTLRSQGKLMEANQLILNRFSFAQEAAQEAAKGLAGQIDTAGELFGLMYESLFNASGASDVATKSFAEFNKELEALVNSEQVEALGKMFRTVTAAIGKALNFAISNIEILSATIVGLSASVIPRFILWVGKIAKSMIGFNLANVAAAKSTKAVDGAMKGASRSAKVLNVSLRAIPFVGIAAGLGSMVATLIALRSESEKAAKPITKQFEEFEDTIRGIPSVSDEMKESVIDSMDGFAEEASRAERELERIKKKREELNSQIVEPVKSRSASGFEVTISPLTDEQTKANKELRAEIARLDQQQEVYNFTLEEFERRSKVAVQGIENIAARNRELGFVISSAVKNADELQKEFLKDEVALKKLQEQLETAKTSVSNMEENRDKLTASELKALDVLKRVVPAIEMEIEKFKEKEEQLSRNSRAYRELTTAMRNNKSEINELQALSTGFMSDLERFDIKANFEAEKEMDSLITRIGSLKDEELPKFAQEIGLSGTALDQFSNRADKLSFLESQFKKIFGAQQQARIEAEKHNNAMRAAQDIVESSKTGFAAINQQFKNQKESISSLKKGTQEYKDALAALEAQNERQKELLRESVEDATRFSPLSAAEQVDKDFKNRQRQILEAYNWEKEAAKEHLAELQKNYDNQMLFTMIGENAQKGADLFTGAMEVMQTAGRENTKQYQKLAIAQATMAQAATIANIWKGATGSGGDIAMAVAKSAIAAAQLGAQIKSIKTQSFADGGHVMGSGTSTSDSIPAWLSNGEFVMNARAVQKIGLSNLEAMNEGRVPKYASGGMVKTPMNSPAPTGSNNGNIEFIVINEVQGVDIEQQERTDENGNRQLVATVKRAVNQGFVDGSFDTSLSMFGNSAGAIQRKPRGR